VVGAVGEGAPHLLAGDPPAAAVRRRPTAQVRHVGSGVGLGKGEGAEELAPGDPRQELTSLLGVEACGELLAAGDQAAAPTVLRS